MDGLLNLFKMAVIKKIADLLIVHYKLLLNKADNNTIYIDVAIRRLIY